MKQLGIIILVGILCIGLIGCSKEMVFNLRETRPIYSSESQSAVINVEQTEDDSVNMERDWQLKDGDSVERNELFSQICQNATYLFVKAVDEVRVVIGYLLDGKLQLTVYHMADQRIEKQIVTNLTSDLILNRISISGNFLQVYDGNHYAVIDLNTGQNQVDIENIREFSDIDRSSQFAYGLYAINFDGTILFYTTFSGENDEIQELHQMNVETGEDTILKTYNFNTYREKELLNIMDLQLTSDGKRLFFYGTYWEQVKDGVPVGSTSFDCFCMDLQNLENDYYPIGNKRYQIYNGGVMIWEEGDFRTGDFGNGILTFLQDGAAEEKELRLSNPKEVWNPFVSSNGTYLLASIEENGTYYYNIYRIADGEICTQFQTKHLSDNITAMDGLNKAFIWDVERQQVEEILIE